MMTFSKIKKTICKNKLSLCCASFPISVNSSNSGRNISDWITLHCAKFLPYNVSGCCGIIHILDIETRCLHHCQTMITRTRLSEISKLIEPDNKNIDISGHVLLKPNLIHCVNLGMPRRHVHKFIVAINSES